MEHIWGNLFAVKNLYLCTLLLSESVKKLMLSATPCSFIARPSYNLDWGHGMEWIDKMYFI